MLSKIDCLKMAESGFWPGPGESEDHFTKRIEYTKTRSTQIPDLFNSERKKSILQITQHAFGITKLQIPVIFQNKGLSFWEGAVVWIDNVSGLAIPSIQIKQNFLKGSYFFYHIEEVVAHEILHAARIEYDESKYEEILAYRTSPQSVRKYIGPLFATVRDTYMFIGLFALGLVFELIALFLGIIEQIPFLSLPVFWILLLGSRLYVRQRRFTTALSHLEKVLPRPLEALSVIAKLKDKEIDILAGLTCYQVIDFLEKQSDSELRIRMLKEVHFGSVIATDKNKEIRG